MDKLYVKFKVSVCDSEYEYSSDRKGTGEVDIQAPRNILDSIEPGNLFVGALQAALAEFDAPRIEEGEA